MAIKLSERAAKAVAKQLGTTPAEAKSLADFAHSLHDFHRFLIALYQPERLTRRLLELGIDIEASLVKCESLALEVELAAAAIERSIARGEKPKVSREAASLWRELLGLKQQLLSLKERALALAEEVRAAQAERLPER